MPESLLAGVRDAGLEFFHLPPEEKLRHANRTDDGEFQPEGYGIDRVDTDEQVLDWCDRLYLAVQPEERRQARFWPARPPSLAGLLNEYAQGSERVARRVLAAMAAALGLGEDFFLRRVGDKPPADARFTYYPPCPRPELVHGLKPHTDNSVVTVLLLDPDVGGLQVLKDGRWVDVPVPGRGELLVVVGEEMEILSNAALRAPTHRVMASAGGERMTLVAGAVLPAGAAQGPGARRGAGRGGPAGAVQETRGQGLRRRVLGRVRARRAHHRLPQGQDRAGAAGTDGGLIPSSSSLVEPVSVSPVRCREHRIHVVHFPCVSVSVSVGVDQYTIVGCSRNNLCQCQ